MTPIDAALDVAMGVTKILDEPVRDWLARVLAAAYAAQFPPVEEHAELVEELRSIDEERLNNEPYSCEQLCKKAADAIEALLADRDALKAENDQHKSVYQKYVEAIDRMNGTPCEQVRHHYEVSELRSELALAVSERDALAARLAPVEDDALVEIVAVYCSPEMNWNEMSEKWKNSCRRDARAAIAAIRPHIEAAERERCAKALEITSDEIRLHAGEMTAQEMRSVLAVLEWRAAAIRSGK